MKRLLCAVALMVVTLSLGCSSGGGSVEIPKENVAPPSPDAAVNMEAPAPHAPPTK